MAHNVQIPFKERLAPNARGVTGPRTLHSRSDAKLLGRGDLRMIRRYTHATDQRRRDAVQKLAVYGQSADDCHKIVTMPKGKAAG